MNKSGPSPLALLENLTDDHWWPTFETLSTGSSLTLLENMTEQWRPIYETPSNDTALYDLSSHFRRPGIVGQYVEVALLSFIMLLGILGNILVFVVCVKRGSVSEQNSTANYFLCSLAASDLLVCAVVIPLHIHLEAAHLYRRVTDLECKLSVYLWNQSMYCTSWLLMGISIDRYYAIGYPLHPKFTKRKARCLISATLVLSLVFAFPSAFLYTGPHCQPLSSHYLNLELLIALIQGTLVFLIPFTVITTAYTAIFCSLRKQNRAQNQYAGTPLHSTHYTVAKRLLLVIIVFAVCWTPGLIMKIYFSFYRLDVHATSMLAFFVYMLEYFMPYFNSILNPIIYALINRAFRKDCRRVVCCQRIRSLHYLQALDGVYQSQVLQKSHQCSSAHDNFETRF